MKVNFFLGLAGAMALPAMIVSLIGPAYAATPNSAYFTVITKTLGDGKSLDETIINGPPTPPPGYELERSAVALPGPGFVGDANSLTVPAFNWVFGCSSVSGAMIAGYYDRNGFPDMYTGPTDGGVMPLDNSSWGTWVDGNGDTYPNIPLAASHEGVDGRVGRGSIDDYWVLYGSAADDPYITGAWTQHTWSDAIGDYMKTSQSAYANTDGSTRFYNYTSSEIPLTCADMFTYGIHNEDGTYGRKLFYEARGYTVTDCYSQKTDNTIAGGFSFAQFKDEIDAGRPVMLNLEGHTIVGVGYADPSTVYVHDTWDYLDHTMIWGTSYSGMALLSVSIVNLQSLAEPGKIGLYRAGSWFMDENDNGLWDGTPTDSLLGKLGLATDKPLVGDWNGDGIKDIGLFRAGYWYLDMNNNGLWDGTTTDALRGKLGLATDVPVVGDWNGDGFSDIGLYRAGNWYLDMNNNGLWDQGNDVLKGKLGLATDVPVVGDWNGDGISEIGLYRAGYWYLDKNNNGLWDGTPTDALLGKLGLATDVPVVGDWNADGISEIGLYRAGYWYLDKNNNGLWDGTPTDSLLGKMGLATDIPVVH